MMEWMQSEDIRRLVEGAPADTLRDFVIRLAERSQDMQMLLVSAFGPGIGDAHLENVKGRVDALIRDYGGKYMSVEYKDSSDFTYDMEELLETQVAALICSKHHKPAADLVCYVFQLLGKVDINDDCGTENLAECCDRMWRLILPLCTPEELREMRPWFLNHPDPAAHVYVPEKYTENILADLFPPCPPS